MRLTPDDRQADPNAPGPAWPWLLGLGVLCAVTFFPGLDVHGVTNWQEGQRLVVAREMQETAQRGRALDGWLIPSINGRPYLAKPPMIYWSQLALAGAMGERVGLWHLRCVVACAGTLGVLAMFLAARRVLPPLCGRPPPAINAASFLAAASMGTGFLYFRSSRIGELDILLVPGVTAAVWASFEAWRCPAGPAGGVRRLGCAAVATVASTLVVMTKDPGLLVVGLAVGGGIWLWEALAASSTPSTSLRWASWLGAAVFAAMSLRNAGSVADVVGVGLHALCGAFVGWLIGSLARPSVARSLASGLLRTHLWLVLGLPVAVRIGWAWLVDQRLGPGTAAVLAGAEADDNLRFFLPESAVNNLQTLAFGAGLASVLAIAGLWLMISHRLRPSPTPGLCVAVAWLVLGAIAFSVLGKGVQRYLTPLWPAAGIIAAAALLHGFRSGGWSSSVRHGRCVLLAMVIVLGLAQTAWYGIGRERFHAARTPRELIGELRVLEGAGAVDRLAAFEFSSPALDYYAGRHVQPVGNPRAGITMTGTRPWRLDRLKSNIARSGPAYLLVRLGPAPGDAPPERGGRPLPVERLRRAGLSVRDLPLESRYEIDSGRTRVGVVMVSLP